MKEKTRQEAKNRHRIDKNNFAIEYFDVVSFHETKAKKTEKRTRETKKEPKESKKERQEGRKKEKTRERQRKIH